MKDIRVFLEFKIPGRSTGIVDSTYGSEAFVDISTRVDYSSLSWENVSSSNTATAKIKVFTVDPIDTSDYTTFTDPAGYRDSLTTAVQDVNWYFDVADRAELRIHDVSGGAAVQDHTVLFSGVVTRVSVYREPGFIIQELEVGDAVQLLSENIITKYYHPADSHADDAISNSTAITNTVTNYSSLPLPEAGTWGGTQNQSTSVSGLRKNIAINPSFETDTTGWIASSSTIAQSSAQAFSGTKSLLVTGTAAVGSGAEMTGAYKSVVVPSTSYSVAGRIRLDTGTTTAAINVAVKWYTSSNTLISTSSSGASVVPTTGGWSLVYVNSVTSPSNAVYASAIFSASNAIAATWYLDGVQIEAESYDGTVTYFDGNSASGGGTTGSRSKTTSDGRRYRLDEDPKTLVRSWVYATIFDATNDPTRFDNILDRSTYVEEIANGLYRFSPYFNDTLTYLPEQRGGRTLLQAIQEMAANEGAAYWIAPGYFDASGNHVRVLYYRRKEIPNLVSNSIFEEGSSAGWEEQYDQISTTYATAYRFTIDAVRGGTGQPSQISDVHFRISGTRQSDGIAFTTSDPNSSSANPPYDETAKEANDGSTATKWLDYNNLSTGSRSMIVVFPTGRNIDSYTWYTANDSTARDPIGWTVSGSLDTSFTTVNVTNVDMSSSIVTLTLDTPVTVSNKQPILVSLSSGPTNYSYVNGAWVTNQARTNSTTITFKRNSLPGTITSGAAVGTIKILTVGSFTTISTESGYSTTTSRQALAYTGSVTAPSQEIVTGTVTGSIGSYIFNVGSSTSGPFDVGYSIYANSQYHADAVMTSASGINTTYGDKFFVSWRVKTANAQKSHPHVRYYHTDGSIHGNTHGYQIAATQAVEGRWTRMYGIITTPNGGATPVTKLGIVLHHDSSNSSYQVNYTDIRIVKITSLFGFSDEPSETDYNIPLRDFEVPSAPKESGVVANRVLVYGIYRSVDASNGQTIMLTGGTGEPIRYLSFDYVQGVWQSGGKIVESVIVDPLVQTGDDAAGRAQAFFNENGLPLISYQFKHTTNGLEIGDVIPFIWNVVGVAEPLIVKSQSSYMIGGDVYYEVQLGGDIQIQKSTVLALQKAIDEINETPITDLGPLAPENVVGATASGAITVTWDYDFSHARNEGLANFEIYRSEGGGTFNLVNTTQATAWSDSAGDSGLDVNQTYQYQVRAVDIDGFYSEMSVASSPVSPGAVSLDGAFDDAYNGLGIDVPKIVTSITYAGTPSIKTITSIARTSPSSTVTVTSNAHGFSAGNVVVITGTGVSTFDGTHIIATVATNTFTYTTTATTTNSASVGKASAYSVSGAYVDNDGVSRNLGDAFSLIQFPKGQLAMSRTDGKLYRNGTTSLTGVTSPWDNKWTRAATDAIDVGPGGTVSITADLITTGTLNAAQVSVTNLSASSISAGTLTLTGLNATAISSTGFTVTNAGVVTATGANISGAITATSGFIGNWDIGANSISNLNSGIYTGLYHSTSTSGVSFHAGSTGVDGAGAKFKVLNDGSMTAGNGQFTVDSAGNITAKSGYYNPDGKPAIMLQGSSSEGDIAVPNTTSMSFGNYNPSTFAFNEQMRLDTNGNLGVYDGYISAATSVTAPRGRFTSTVDASGTNGTHGLTIGSATGQRIEIDGNEISSWTDTSGTGYGQLNLNPDGGLVQVGGTTFADFAVKNGGNININTLSSQSIGGIASEVGAFMSGTGVSVFRRNSTTAGAFVYGAYRGWTGSSTSVIRMVQFARETSSGGTMEDRGYINISTSAAQPAFAAASDYRLKTNIRDAKETVDFFDIVKRIRIATFDRIDDSGTKDYVGYIAHELQEVVPEAVSGHKDEVDTEGNPIYQSVMEAHTYKYALGALQEAIEKIESLEARVAELES